MEGTLSADLARLDTLAFRRREKIGGLLRDVHRLLATKKSHRDYRWLLVIKNWLLVPLTLWPIDFAGLGAYACARLRLGQRLDGRIVFILEESQHLPDAKAQKAIAEYERFVQQGDYEPLIRAKTKYATQEKELLGNRTLRKEWINLKRLFPVNQFRDRKGIVRRRMAQERNFRPDWRFSWRTKKERFQTAFDAFCHRWNLYGMEGDQPLLLKLSVNPTAHGLMIVIPCYWSLDSKRDLNWREINRLHKARGALRQGPKMSEGRLERRRQARWAYQAAQTARKLKLKGIERIEFIMKKARLPNTTDPRTMRRLVNEGAGLITAAGNA